MSASSPGWTRRRRGRGFSYLDENGRPLATDEVARCRSLAIPPAWRDVWICPFDNGHLQAVGTDDAGRRQYLYHPRWREQRDRAKHDRVLEVGRRLPRARAKVAELLAIDGMPRERALAVAFRLLDRGLFRVGGEGYAEENGSYGLATIEKRHVKVSGDELRFTFESKSGQLLDVTIVDALARPAVVTMLRRRGGGPQLLAYRDGRRWRDVSSRDINEFVRDVVGGDVSAKDFRTWHATVAAAVALADAAPETTTKAARRRTLRRAAEAASEQLGNTPAVARRSYVDPRVVDRFEAGDTIPLGGKRPPVNGDAGFHRAERAVLRLLRD